MKHCWLIILIVGYWIIFSTQGMATPRQASAIRTAYEKSLEAWQIKLQLAQTNDERVALFDERPDAEKAARQMWGLVRRELDQAWTLEPAAWFLKISSGLVGRNQEGGQAWVLAREIEQVREAIKTHHIKNPDLGPLCLSLVALNDSKALKLLRQIEEKNPHEKVSGLAALGIAMMLKDIGEDPDHRLIRERLKMLRKATIQAGNVVIDEVNVSDLIQEELYIINHLTIGKQAPNIIGVDSGGRNLSLAAFDDRVVILIFWRVNTEESKNMLDWVKRLRNSEKFTQAPFEIVGVCHGPSSDLRGLQREGRLSWPNIVDPNGEHAATYRVGTYPLAYVLGPDRKIHYIGKVGTFAEMTAAAVLEDL